MLAVADPRSMSLLVLILVLAFIGVLVIAGLSWAFRRQQRRRSGRRRPPQPAGVDPWAESGRRARPSTPHGGPDQD